ncbi:MAG: hypothetical protein ACKOU6_14495 [Planctomycetota bacterium]
MELKRFEVSPLTFPDKKTSGDDGHSIAADSKLQAELRKEEDDRKNLINKSVDCIGNSGDALTALAKRLQVPDHPDPTELARRTIDELLSKGYLPTVLVELVLTIKDLEELNKKTAIKSLYHLAQFIMPAALIGDNLSQIRRLVTSVDDESVFSGATKSLVEIAMARMGGRATVFMPLRSSRDEPHGRYCLDDPPEAGMDADDGEFIKDFVGRLSKDIPPSLISMDDRKKTLKAINSFLNKELKVNKKQLYYVFRNLPTEPERRKRRALAKRLSEEFPLIAFVALDNNSTELEIDVIPYLQELLSRAPKIEIKPHGN